MVDDESWHLNKKVIVGIITALVMQSLTFMGSAWALVRSMDADIKLNTYDIMALKNEQVEDKIINKSYTAFKATVESKITSLDRGQVRLEQGQVRIEKKLDRLIERGN